MSEPRRCACGAECVPGETMCARCQIDAWTAKEIEDAKDAVHDCMADTDWQTRLQDDGR